MAAKITVNGVTYDSVGAMPPEVRRVYEQTVSKVPELADRDGDGIPDIVQDGSLSVRRGVTVRKRIVVNGTTYEDEASMPPDVRQLYQQAMRRLGGGGAAVRRSDIKMSFQVKGPALGTHQTFGTASPSQASDRAAGPLSTQLPTPGTPIPSPIEPASGGGGLRVALVLGASVAAAAALWFLMRAH